MISYILLGSWLNSNVNHQDRKQTKRSNFSHNRPQIIFFFFFFDDHFRDELKRVKQCYDVKLFAKRDAVYGLVRQLTQTLCWRQML